MGNVWDLYDGIVAQGTSNRRRVEARDSLVFTLPDDRSDFSMMNFLTEVIRPALNNIKDLCEKTGKPATFIIDDQTMTYTPSKGWSVTRKRQSKG